MADPQPVVFRRAHGVAPRATEEDLAAAQAAQKPTPPPREMRQVRKAGKQPDLAAPYVPEHAIAGDPYEQVLNDLRRKQAEIDIAIKAIEALR